MNIGWIGTGNMGHGMAMRLIKAGYRINVYNRTKEKAQDLVDTEKAVFCESPARIFDQSDIIFVSITNDAVWDDFLNDEKGISSSVRAGQTIVEMSTLSPDYSAQLKKRFNAWGCTYIDAPVIGSMFMIDAGLLKVLASGDREAYDIAFPYLQAIGRSVRYMGDGLQARYMKIAVNMMICSYLTIYGEVLLAGEAMGLGWEELNNLLEASEGASHMLDDKGTLHRERIWGSTTATTGIAMKDLGLALETACRKGFSLPLTAIICQYDRFMHFNGKYSTYSTFGTIGVLENICQTGPAQTSSVVSDKCREALGISLTAVTTLLAMETMKFCKNTGIQGTDAKEILATCHGASRYFAGMYKGETSALTVEQARASVNSVLNTVIDKGIFVPIMAEASQQLNECNGMMDLKEEFDV